MKDHIKLVCVFLVVLLLGCNSSPSNEGFVAADQPYTVASSEQMEMAAKRAPTADVVETERKLIKQGNLAYEVEDLTKTRAHILALTTKYKGYISSDNEYKNEQEISVSINLKVPAENFDKLIEEISEGVKRFDQKQITISDVTEEFLDISARLKTKKELEKRYFEILKQAKSVADILEVERQMSVLRSDIESIEGRLKYLESQVSFSSLNIRFYQTLDKQTEFGKKFSQGFKNGWQNLIWFFVFMVNIWPFIILLIVIFFLLKYWIKRDKKTKA